MKKNQNIQRINDRFAGFAEWVLDHRKLVIVACVILCVGAGYLTTKLYPDFENKFIFPDDDPAVDYYQNFLEEYGNDEFLYILYSTEEGVFDLETLRKTRMLVEDLKSLQYVKKVSSIINLEFLEGDNNGNLRIFSLINEFPTSPFEAERLKQKILDKPIYVNTYVSEDTKYAAILCDIGEKPDKDKAYHKKIGSSLQHLLSKPDYKEFKFYPAGNPVIVSTLYNLTEENLVRTGLLSFFLITLLLVFLLRQFKGIIGPFIVMELTLLLVLAFMAMLDFPITMMFGMIPSVLMAVCLADAIHIITEYQIHLRAGNDNRTSIIEAVRLLGFPCLFTSITTMIGFGSLYFSSIKAIRDFGISIAFGTLIALGMSISILLLVLALSGKKTEEKYKRTEVKTKSKFMDWALDRIALLNNRHYKKVLLITVMLCVVIGFGITKMEAKTSWLVAFGDKTQVFHDYKMIDRIMGGTGNFEILLDSKEPDGVKTLRFVRTLEKIQNFANTRDYLVKKTISVIDMIKDVNRALNNNDKSFYRVPSSDNTELQNVNELVYELYGGEKLEKFVSSDLASARLTTYIKLTDSNVYNRFHDELVEYIESVKPADYKYIITGASYVQMRGFDCLTKIMAKSLLLALIFISVLMIFIFRSFKIGILSIIPNIFPVLFALGFMGLTGIWLSQVTSIIGCIAIGLAVDDTIHFISRYRMEFDRLGNYRRALEASMRGVGRALTITTVILVIGFGSFMVSNINSYFETGLLMAVCFSVALLADLFIAPALILLFKPFGKEFTPVKEAEIQAEVKV